ncbi:MAG: flagellar filament capping protein FliD [Lachnospira sp.]|nr:flagellar filament capping protein FliD [Lachnospira sp.]
MGIRLSGMISGMDTEALVSALVSSYSLKKDNLVKAQTKHSWKQESWKAMNTKIYSFYSGKLSAARLSKSYDLKTAAISNSIYAKVTASSSAVNGTQTLKVEELAATGYLTGGEITGTDGAKIKGSSKIGDIKGMSGITDGALSVEVNGKTTKINVDADMTVNQLVAKFKEAGLNASFDEQNQRFFISAKESGKANDFSLTADNASGLSTLQNLGLYTANASDTAEYEQWAKYTKAENQAEFQALIDDAFNKSKVDVNARAKEYANKYNAAKKVVDTIDGDGTITKAEGQSTEEALEAGITGLKSKLATDYADYAVTDAEGKVTYDTEKMKEDGKLEEYNALQSKISAAENNLKLYQENKAVMADMEQYVTIADDGSAVAATAEDADQTKFAAVQAVVDAENATIRSKIEEEYTKKAQFAEQMVNTSAAASNGAVRITGENARIVLNGATFTSNTNSFSINGLTIQATAKTAGEQVTITTSTDVDAIYDSIKSMFKEYNELIKAMDEAYNADSSKGYEPLTSDEKEAMSEDEIEKWEKKIKDSLLRKDSLLGSASTALKNAFASVYEIDGVKYSLSSFGIKTQGYFQAATNERGVYHIDGDSDDTVSAGSDDKLRAMIASNPEAVVSFFSQLSSKVYDELGKKMASSSVSSVYTIYNDKEMATEYSEYNTRISDMEDEITRWEDYYYKKFSGMESAMAKLNSQQSALSGLLGQ